MRSTRHGAATLLQLGLQPQKARQTGSRYVIQHSRNNNNNNSSKRTTTTTETITARACDEWGNTLTEWSHVNSDSSWYSTRPFSDQKKVYSARPDDDSNCLLLQSQTFIHSTSSLSGVSISLIRRQHAIANPTICTPSPNAPTVLHAYYTRWPEKLAPFFVRRFSKSFHCQNHEHL